MNWLYEAVQDPSGRVSSKRIAMLTATFSLGLSTVILSIAPFFGHDTAIAIGAVSVPLAGLGGYSYVRGIHADNAGKLKDVT